MYLWFNARDASSGVKSLLHYAIDIKGGSGFSVKHSITLIPYGYDIKNLKLSLLGLKIWTAQTLVLSAIMPLFCIAMVLI